MLTHTGNCLFQVNALLENSSAQVFAILASIFKGMAAHGLPPSRSASPFAAAGALPGPNGLTKLVSPLRLQLI